MAATATSPLPARRGLARFLPFGHERKSFLERNQTVIGALGIAAILVGSAFALLLSGGVFARTYRVTAYFADAAGIQPGDDVTVAGLKAGTVKAVRIDRGRVAMDLGISRGVTLPADSRAAVVIQTLLGKETVSIVAGRAQTVLQGGSVIPETRTTTPVSISQLNDISVRLLNRSDGNALNTFLAELTKVTDGKGQQVTDIVDGLSALLRAVDARRTQLSQLITALKDVTTTLGQRDRTVVSLIDNLDPVLADLAARQQDIQALLVVTDSASHDTADLVARNRRVLDQSLAALHQDLTVIDQHQVDLAAGVAYLDQAVQGYQSVGYSQGVPNRWANIFVQSLGPAGVDALLGQCGLVDQLFDQAFGADCRKAPKGLNLPGGLGGATGGLGGLGGLGGGLPGGGGTGTGDGLPGLPGGPGRAPAPPGGGSGESAPDHPLPGSVDDFLVWVIGPGQGGPQ